MKIRSIVKFLLFFAGFMFVISLIRSPAVHAGAVYDPGLVYKGPFVSSWIYYHEDDSTGRQWIHGGDAGKLFPLAVSCSAAQLELRQHGAWRGRLNGDGSCGGKDAPVIRLAVGNWLNYRKSIVAN